MNPKWYPVALPAIVVLTLAACSAVWMHLALHHQRDKVARLELDDSTLRAELEVSEARIEGLEQRLLNLELKPSHDSAIFTPSDKGYQRIDTETGAFLVILTDIKPYANGHKLFLRVGNPTYATYHGVKAKVIWGTDLDLKNKKYTEWKNSLREAVFPITSNIRPGAWNRIELVLSPSKADEVGYIEISLTTDNVSLFSR